MSRIVPTPLTSAAIFLLWMVLAVEPDGGSILFAAIIALGLPWLSRAYLCDLPTIRRPGKAVQLFLIVCYDIMVANVQVAIQVLGPIRRLSPGFVDVPLAIEDPFVATILGSIVTLTPGTVSIDVDQDARILKIHALHLPDRQHLIDEIKGRYEGRLKEIFGC